LADKFSLVRSLHHTMASHNDGSIEVLTGKTPAKEDVTSTAKSDHPDFGMIASRLRGTSASGLPQYVGIPRVPFMVRPRVSMTHRLPPAILRAQFSPTQFVLDAGIDGSRRATAADCAVGSLSPSPGSA
jgi:hypothetical protein